MTTVSYLDQSMARLPPLFRGFAATLPTASSTAGSAAFGSDAASMSLNRASWPGTTFSDLGANLRWLASFSFSTMS